MTFQKVADISIFRLAGDIELFEGRELRRSLARLIHTDWPKIILDFDRVEHVDFKVLVDMVSLVVAAHTLRGQIKLANMSLYHRNILRVSGVEDFFETFDSLESAIMSFEGGIVSQAGPC
ncbi:MAG: STAS domain-containing protein [Deltaproteobacteria bacterium]|nr:STAS domain-containing protein [Deltaproteobacteria bacterium]MBI2500714.1 STAS domain-containing protein [Deltaproteobacteria bacterium]